MIKIKKRDINFKEKLWHELKTALNSHSTAPSLFCPPSPSSPHAERRISCIVASAKRHRFHKKRIFKSVSLIKSIKKSWKKYDERNTFNRIDKNKKCVTNDEQQRIKRNVKSIIMNKKSVKKQHFSNRIYVINFKKKHKIIFTQYIE